MLCALIMAGGKGTRFWPLSTEEKPKQFLNLVGKNTMIQMTVNRISKFVPMDRIFICTTNEYVDLVKTQIKNINNDNIIIEPEGRNTAPCIALSAMMIKRKYKESNIVVLPSDHLIEDENQFIEIINCADKFLNENKKNIVTLGMKPNRAETGYGYIKRKNSKKIVNGKVVYEVNKFVEKPNKELAQLYIKDDSYMWNSGVFIWNIDNIINLVKEYLPNTYEALNGIVEVEECYIKDLLKQRYMYTDQISIDYGILEKSNDICVIPCEVGWDDVGNWTSVERYCKKDEDGNVFKGDGILYNCKNNIVVANKKILINNVENLIIVETDEYVMISSKENEQKIKEAKSCLA